MEELILLFFKIRGYNFYIQKTDFAICEAKEHILDKDKFIEIVLMNNKMDY